MIFADMQHKFISPCTDQTRTVNIVGPFIRNQNDIVTIPDTKLWLQPTLEVWPPHHSIQIINTKKPLNNTTAGASKITMLIST